MPSDSIKLCTWQQRLACLVFAWLQKCGVGQPLSADEDNVIVVWLVACHDELLQLQLCNTSVFVMLACVSWLLPEESWLRSDLVVRPAACDASMGSAIHGGAANSSKGLDVQCLFCFKPDLALVLQRRSAMIHACNVTLRMCWVVHCSVVWVI